MTRRAAKVCVHVSGRICAALCERNSRQVRERGWAAVDWVHLCLCVCLLLKEERLYGRKKERWPLACLQGRDEKERGEEQEENWGWGRKGKEKEDGGGIISFSFFFFLKPDRPLTVSLSLFHVSTKLSSSFPSFLLSHFLLRRLSLSLSPLGAVTAFNIVP